ncbi:hypothetical protein [Aneurinibacillus aneurinilyticus]|uniref:hypothetical protein n=1 Tax=Aneurinibacillus aneurinilyticus TaxID=1391 RepID=UPI00352326D3
MDMYERTLFQRAKIERRVEGDNKYNPKSKFKKIAEDVPCGIGNKTGTATAIRDGIGNVEVQQIYIMHTRFPDIKAGDIITITGGGVVFGKYRAAPPYPVMDTEGIHHYEITLEVTNDA